MMKAKNFYLGSFVNVQAPNFLVSAVENARSYGANTMMFFAGSPRALRPLDKNKFNASKFHQALEVNNIDLKKVVIHAPYLINLANLSSTSTYNYSVDFLKHTLKSAVYLGVNLVVLHPGAALKNDRQKAMKQISASLDEILPQFPSIKLCLETMSGAGTQLGYKFEELKYIIDNAKSKNQIAVCWDLCHLYSAGYDLVNKLREVVNDFARIVGFSKLAVVHVNDSLKPFASRIDRHANINEGTIGLEPIVKILSLPELENIPLILETPYINDQPPYKEEITLLKNALFKN